MQSLDLIKKRIKSIEATRKITNAMKLVATTKIKAQRKSYDATSHFCRDYYRIFKTLLAKIENFDFLRDKPCKNHKTLYVVITSDLGLCGAYNSSVCKHLANEIQPDDEVIVYGQKGVSWLKAHHMGNYIIKKRHWDIQDGNYYAIIPLCYDIADAFRNGKYETIKLVSTKFISSVKYTPTTWTMLPLSRGGVNSQGELLGLDKDKYVFNPVIFEPDAKHILKVNIPVYISNFIYGALIEASLCESSSRRFAMEGATKNATELIDNLKIQYNQARQESITQEINEIIAGTIGKK